MRTLRGMLFFSSCLRVPWGACYPRGGSFLCGSIFNLWYKYTPNNKPRKSMIKSITWKARPGTKSWWISSLNAKAIVMRSKVKLLSCWAVKLLKRCVFPMPTGFEEFVVVDRIVEKNARATRNAPPRKWSRSPTGSLKACELLRKDGRRGSTTHFNRVWYAWAGRGALRHAPRRTRGVFRDYTLQIGILRKLGK